MTGANGFVGTNIQTYFINKFEFKNYKKNTNLEIRESIVFHFAGIAHDLKKTINPVQYYQVNTEFTKIIFDEFLASDAKVFIMLSSVKAVADRSKFELTEDFIPNPVTDYGKSKLLAEKYILSKIIPKGKRVYILRPCMIHGPGNRGNLNLLYKIIYKNVPWPLGSFENKRSFCSIDNLCFIINEIIDNNNIPSGIYNIADDEPLSTNELIILISKCLKKSSRIWKIPPFFIKTFAIIGDLLLLPLNSERLNKLTENFIVSNKKIKHAINKPLPLTSKDGLIKTLNSFINA